MLPRISKVEVCVSTEADILCRVLVSMINLPYSQEYANYNNVLLLIKVHIS